MCSLPPVRNEHPLPDLSGPSDLSVCAPVTDENPEVPLQNHAVSSANEGISARVARVAYCQDATCSFAGLSPHLSVEIDDVPLESNNATAISYTWGEFRREKTSIGHMHGDASACVQLELGKKWVIRDFIDRLAEFAKDSPIWIDQICIPQKEEAIRQVLANIPSIFRTFDVVALMPGHPCKCLDDVLENRVPLILAAEDKTFDEKGRELHVLMDDLCLNGLVPSSWFNRIWTRQELIYSRQIRCVWASTQRAKCVSLEALERNDLEPYMALYLEQLEGNGFSKIERAIQLDLYQASWYQAAYYELTFYLRSHIRTVPLIANVLRFFGGESFRNGRTTTDPTSRTFMKGFIQDLHSIGSMRQELTSRRATHSCDYVVSVWVDCPGYIVPKGHRLMDAPELLNNAMTQLMHNHGMALFSNAPRGLFDSESSGSALFDAVMHFSATPIHHVVDLYGPLSTESSSALLVDQTGAVPILLSARHPVALSDHAEEYSIFSEQFGKGDSSTLIPFFQVVFSLCSKLRTFRLMDLRRDLHKRWLKSYLKGEQLCEEMVHAERSLGLIEKLTCKNERLSQYPTHHSSQHHPPWEDIFDDLLEKVLYELMAACLGIKYQSCRAAGVAIMVDPGDPEVARPPRIGFFRGDVDLRKLGRSQDPGQGVQRAVTVCMTSSEWQSLTSDELGEAETLFEAYQVEGFGSEDVPKYRVFGVWIPTAVTKSEEYGACLGSLEEGGADAFLV